MLVLVAGFDEVIGVDDEADLAQGHDEFLFVFCHQGFQQVFALFVPQPDVVFEGIGYKIAEVVAVFLQLCGGYSFF